MKQRFESISEEDFPPMVKILEEDHASHKKTERPLNAIPDSSIKNPDTASPTERNDNFAKAYNYVVGNFFLERLIIKGIKGDVSAFSEFTNAMTEFCLSLSDEEIDNIVRKFKETLRQKTDFYSSKFNLDREEQLHLKSDFKFESGHKTRPTIDSLGIKSVAHFIRARKKLHELKPEMIPVFYFENYLDARHKIDLIEVLEGNDGAILNLIQIKSTKNVHGHTENVVRAHKDWIDGFTIDVRAYEKSFSVEPADSGHFKEFITNISQVEEIFLDILTGEASMSYEELFERLGIGKRPKVEQVWIMENCLPAFIENVEIFKSDGTIDDESYKTIHFVLDKIKEELKTVMNRKKDLTGISEVHSILAVDKEVISDEIIFNAKGGDRKAIRIQH